MTKFTRWQTTCALFVLFAATAIIAPAQTFTVLANLNGNDGAVSFSPLSQGTDGSLYGTATEGGDYQDCYPFSCGTIFKLDRTGALIDVHLFNGLDGATPAAGLLLGGDGNFYGTTVTGGENQGNVGRGSVFRMTADGVLTTLYAFCIQTNCPDGGGINGLIEARDGNFYGTTYYGGSAHGACSPGGQPGCGTLFKITPDGTLTTLYEFCAQSGCIDGSNPFANLVQGRDGNLYGLTTGGGTNCFPYGCGTVFKISLNGSLVTLHSFDGTDGSMPTGGLIQAKDGNFYGTTESGGKSGGGTVFKNYCERDIDDALRVLPGNELQRRIWTKRSSGNAG